MTSKEILQADILDILFENRNKDYGAYLLRRNYNNRLSVALSSALTIVFLLILITTNEKKVEKENFIKNGDSVTVLELPAAEPEEPEPIKEKTKAASRVAQVQYTSQIKIVENEKTDLPEITDVAEKIVSTMNVEAELPADPNQKIIVEKKDADKKDAETVIKNDFKPEEREPEFPGGQEALGRFFSRNLNTPDDLEPGDKRIILVRFIVDADGAVSKIEIAQSGGDKYDKEVIRVFKKMPRWKPAIQNGHTVAVHFTQPVTFVGLKE